MRAAPIAVTTGEPAGIGPEVSLKGALSTDLPLVLLGDRDLLKATAQKLHITWPLPARIAIEHIPLYAPAVSGQLDVRNAQYVLDTLSRGCDGALTQEFCAVCTAPVQKSIITEAGHPFTGHTEFFRDRSHVKEVVMMLVSSAEPQALRVALATTHLPLRAVPDAISTDLLHRIFTILHTGLKESYGLPYPRIACTGLNPHAGENGHMGVEEIEVIAPAIAWARSHGMDISGPWPADTIFVRSHSVHYDAVLCMYHDQGLPVLKREGFGHGVNLTLVLPWVRTSVDHGTALDIAGQGIADAGSMVSALELAALIARNRGFLVSHT